MVMEVVLEEMGDGNTQCTNHPYKNSTPGGICAFCLQEKLGKLVSSSFSAAVFPSSSSPSPSFRSDQFAHTNTITKPPPPSSSLNPQNEGSDRNYYTSHYHHIRKARLPFVLTKNRKKKDGVGVEVSDPTSIVFKRSKSIATPKRGILNDYPTYAQDYDNSPHRRRFWSFLYNTTKHSTTTPKESFVKNHFGSSSSSSSSSSQLTSREKNKREEGIIVMVDENGSPDEVSFDRKVSRSRSVGCGSRSFSGDFFERISTGFGDCTLRRVESQREGKPPKVQQQPPMNGQDCIKHRVSCGGIFGGFMVNSSSSSLSSSHWVASTGEDHHQISSARTRKWGSWAFASPMRAFGNKTSSATKRDKKGTPNLAAIPSLLAANG